MSMHCHLFARIHVTVLLVQKSKCPTPVFMTSIILFEAMQMFIDFKSYRVLPDM